MTILKCPSCGAYFECKPNGEDIPILCQLCTYRFRRLMEEPA